MNARNDRPKEDLNLPTDSAGFQSRAMGGVSVTFVAQLAKTLLSIVSQVVLARLLFPEDFGLLAMAAPVVIFIGLFGDLGFGHAIVQRALITESQLSILFWANLVMSGLIASAVFGAGFVAAGAYQREELVGIFAAFAMLIPISALLVHPNSLLLRRMQFAAIARNEVACTVLSLIVTIIFAYRGFSYWSLIIGQAAQVVLANALAWTSARWAPSWPRYDSSLWQDMKMGGGLTGANIASFLTTSGDDVIVGATAGPVDLGYYDRSYRLVVQPLSQIINPIGRVAVPLLSRLSEDPASYRDSYIYMLKGLVFMTLPVMLVCIVSGRALISVVLGDRWEPAAPIFVWICVGGLTSAINTSSYWLFTSQGRTGELFKYTLGVSALAVGSFVIGNQWGAVGVAACAASVFVLIITPLMVFGATRRGPVTGFQVLSCVLPFAVAGTTTFVVLQFVLSAADLTDLVEVALVATVCPTLYTALLLLFPSGRADARMAIQFGSARLQKGSSNGA